MLGEALQRQRQVRAALGRRECMNLVDDDGFDRGQGGCRLRAEHKVERLGCRHQDVRRIADLLLAFPLRRIAGADRDPGPAERQPEPFGDALDADQRRAQGALDVVNQRFQRRDVEHAHAGVRVHRQRAEPIDRGEERGQCFAAAGGCDQQRVFAVDDARPAARLHPRRLAETVVEPALGGRIKHWPRRRTAPRTARAPCRWYRPRRRFCRRGSASRGRNAAPCRRGNAGSPEFR